MASPIKSGGFVKFRVIDDIHVIACYYDQVEGGYVMRHKFLVSLGTLVLLLTSTILLPTVEVLGNKEPYSQLERISVPGGLPPTPLEQRPEGEPLDSLTSDSTNILSDVPSFDWSYGCSATSAAMMFGYYDRTGYDNMYTGPTDGGLCPLSNSVWGSGGMYNECPLSATHAGVDGRTAPGHVDDYWISYGSPGPDPWEGGIEHTHGDCTANFMGTNQWKYGGTPPTYNKDGETIFWYYVDGGKTPDFVLETLEPSDRDGGYGMKLFAESRGYTCSMYNQFIAELDLEYGFTFDEYMAEIDAGRPVIIHVEGHSMLGFGYNTDRTVYLRDTWDDDPTSIYEMTWGDQYGGRSHIGVTVLQIDPPGIIESYVVKPQATSTSVNQPQSGPTSQDINAMPPTFDPELDTFMQSDEFQYCEWVWIIGEYFVPSNYYVIWIQPYEPDVQVTEGYVFNPSLCPPGFDDPTVQPIIVQADSYGHLERIDTTTGTVTHLGSDNNGNPLPIPIWHVADDLICTRWEIITDHTTNFPGQFEYQGGTYHANIDALDAIEADRCGFHIYPEMPTFMLFGLGLVSITGCLTVRRIFHQKIKKRRITAFPIL